MWEFIRKCLGLEYTGGSKKIAKERLRLVLIHDRLGISPGLLENLKEDLIKVISKYMEIDTSRLEVSINEHKDVIALVANIPLLGAK